METWWNVDLGQIYSVFSIRILFKDYGEEYVLRQRSRFAGFSLYLSNSSNRKEGKRCYKDGPDLPPLDFETTCTGYARYVIFYNERRPNEPLSFTELCEVIVQGCYLDGVYGERCDKKCPESCHEDKCEIVTGACFACKRGLQGEKCRKPCDSGYYGEFCSSKCSSKCINNCDHLDGTCICSHGLRGSPNCTKGCPTGFYGPNCGHICSQHCKLNSSCDSINGTCPLGCKDSYWGLKCDVPSKIVIFVTSK
ncbi:multiple epidermal growth factor-like domains protein 10 [Saccostrea cucullata]|uniref:multiple epidermal growth factor-like domains protein 10 n=1 Tax=Saccostrea cuccullata TaxID=36930 RepID=UPI002ED08B82